MPYRITAIRQNRKFVSIVPRGRLTYMIIKHLKALNFKLADIKALLLHSDVHSQVRLLSEPEFFALTENHPQLDWIYSALTLNDNQRIYFHINWHMSKTQWQKLTKELAELNIVVETLPGKDLHRHDIYDLNAPADTNES